MDVTRSQLGVENSCGRCSIRRSLLSSLDGASGRCVRAPRPWCAPLVPLAENRSLTIGPSPDGVRRRVACPARAQAALQTGLRGPADELCARVWLWVGRGA